MLASIDVGTTKIKLSVYDQNLVKVHNEAISIPLTSEGLQDAESLFGAVRLLARRAKEEGAKNLGIATYRASVVAWRKDGTPLTPIVTWMNSDGAETYRRLPLYLRGLSHISPFDLIISPYSPLMRFLRLRELRPDLPKYLESGECMNWTIDSYIMYRLTGRFVSDATSSTLTGLIHPRTFKPIGIIMSLLGLRNPLPEVVDNTEYLGEFEGLEISALIADQQAAAVAEGALRPGITKVTFGTGTFVDMPTEGFKQIKGLIPLVLLRSGKSTFYGVEGYVPATGMMLEKMVAMGWLSDYSELDAKSFDDGVLFLPALAGLQLPRFPRARGVIYGLNLGTTRENIVSAFLKSIAFHVRYILESARTRTRVIRANGGLARAGQLLKLTSAITGIPTERQNDIEGTSLGVAILLGISVGKYHLSEIESLRRSVEVFRETKIKALEDEYVKWTKLIRSLKSFRSLFQTG